MLGTTPLVGIAVTLFSLGVVLLWAFTKNWFLNDGSSVRVSPHAAVLALALIMMFLTSIRLTSLKVGALLLILALLYDIFWVFISGHVFGKNVMCLFSAPSLLRGRVTVATGLDVPIKILIPLFFPSSSQQSFTLIGLGDIVALAFSG